MLTPFEVPTRYPLDISIEEIFPNVSRLKIILKCVEPLTGPLKNLDYSFNSYISKTNYNGGHNGLFGLSQDLHVTIKKYLILRYYFLRNICTTLRPAKLSGSNAPSEIIVLPCEEFHDDFCKGWGFIY